MKNNLTTAAGPAEPGKGRGATSSGAGARHGAGQSGQQSAHIDAINQVFALFQLNYHNQYHKAYGTGSNLNHAKRLWLEMLSRFSPETLLRAAKAVIETSEYLPTLRTMIVFCEKYGEHGELPDAHSAYIEACRAPSPKSDHKWSHPAVYHAGRASDWFYLQSNPEAVAFPVFKAHYEEICIQVRSGVKLSIPKQPALANETESPLEPEENAERLAALRAQLDL